MIVNVRGTSGSGKSTLVRAVIESYAVRVPVHVPGRKRPLCYRLWRDSQFYAQDTFQDTFQGQNLPPQERPPDLVVLGHYDTACGGCDTIPTTQEAFDMAVEAHHLLGCHVLYEGLLLSADIKHTLALAADVGVENLLVVELATSLEECLASVNKRRAARDTTLPPVNPKNTESKWKGVRSSTQKLLDAGVAVETLDREAALARVLEVLS